LKVSLNGLGPKALQQTGFDDARSDGTGRNLYHPLLRLLPFCQGTSRPQGDQVLGDRRERRSAGAQQDDRARQWAHHRAADFRRLDSYWWLRRSVCTASGRRARSAARRRRHHTRGIRMSTQMSAPATFTVGLVQMRSGLTPAANLDTAVKLIGDAKAAGADYVQTPEMTNIMDIRRERMLATVVSEENDVSLARLRELARSLSIWLHVGSLAIKVSPDRAANRSFLIDPAGEIVA